MLKSLGGGRDRKLDEDPVDTDMALFRHLSAAHPVSLLYKRSLCFKTVLENVVVLTSLAVTLQKLHIYSFFPFVFSSFI